MSFELDHVLICAPESAPIADRLVEAGFAEGSPNRHPGQGTANRRFFFDNAFVEFIWVVDKEEIRSDLVAPTRLWERMNWRETGASPFEVCVKPSGVEPVLIPFSTFAYAPDYLPPGTHIPMADRVPIEEPGAFVNLSRRGIPSSPDDGQPRDHRNGARKIESVTFITPQPPDSDVSLALSATGFVTYRAGDSHGIEIEFGGGSSTDSLDLRPELPVVLNW